MKPLPELDAAHTVLVIAWSGSEPDRVGEVILRPHGARELVLGRGGQAASDGTPAAQLSQVRLRRVAARPPLEDPWLSRDQLRLTWTSGGVGVRPTGNRRMCIGGEVTRDPALLLPGQVVELDARLLLLCVRRSLALMAEAPRPTFGFGQPDDAGFVGESDVAWAHRVSGSTQAPALHTRPSDVPLALRHSLGSLQRAEPELLARFLPVDDDDWLPSDMPRLGLDLVAAACVAGTLTDQASVDALVRTAAAESSGDTLVCTAGTVDLLAGG